MSFDLFRMMELRRQGFRCSQIIMALGLEAGGKDNPDVIRAMTGLLWRDWFFREYLRLFNRRGLFIGFICRQGDAGGRGT